MERALGTMIYLIKGDLFIGKTHHTSNRIIYIEIQYNLTYNVKK